MRPVLACCLACCAILGCSRDDNARVDVVQADPSAAFDPKDLDRTASWLKTLEDEYQRAVDSGNALQIKDARGKLSAAVKQVEPQRVDWAMVFGGMAGDNFRFDEIEYRGVSVLVSTGEKHTGFRPGQDMPVDFAKSLNRGDRVRVVGKLESVDRSFEIHSNLFSVTLSDVEVSRP